jgi:hypothetical protein
MTTYTNDFKDMTDADPALVKKGQQTVLLDAVQRQMFCQISGKILDKRKAVLVIPSVSGMVVMTADVWDARKELATTEMGKAGVTFEVYDGRELWS